MKRDEKHRILIVEDDQIFRELLVVALTLRGYVVYVAEDGQRAMTVIKNARPHLVTVDLRMPRTDGLRFLEWLRGTRRFGSVPAIVVTAVDDKGTAVDALVSGASDVLTKPVDLDVLATRIEALLAGRLAVEDASADDSLEPPEPKPPEREPPEPARQSAADATVEATSTSASAEGGEFFVADPHSPAVASADGGDFPRSAQETDGEEAAHDDDAHGHAEGDDHGDGEPAVDSRAETGTVVERAHE